jgi:hypothetical protein
MKVCRSIFRFCVAFLATVGPGLPAHAAGVSTAEYRQQLHDLDSQIEQLKEHPERARQFENRLPDHVSVSDGAHEYSVSYDWLKKELRQFAQAEPQTRSVFLQHIQDHLKQLDAEAQAYENANEASGSDQQKLNQILSRREFHNAHGPSWWEITRDRILRRLASFFGRRMVGRGAEDLLHLVVYLAAAVAFVMFAIWIKKRFSRPGEDFSREIVPFAPSSRGWASWLGEARASAQQGDWRNGVHLAYWAGISFLEANGAWKPDRARTPREYLRILGTRKPQYQTLFALTRKFEVIWYGRREAQAADFSEALQQLEKLGCK